MWFGEPQPFPERGSLTRLSASGQQRYEGWSCISCGLCGWMNMEHLWNELIGGVRRYGGNKNLLQTSFCSPQIPHWSHSEACERTGAKHLSCGTTSIGFYKRNAIVEERSRNLCYRTKAIGITYSECVLLYLFFCHVMHMGHIIVVICDQSGFTILPTLSHKRFYFLGGEYWTQNVFTQWSVPTHAHFNVTG
jgi:hypothetical protein